MASLYKKPVFLVDPKTGQRIKTKSKKWWGRFRNEHGIERRVPLAVDKLAAQTMLNALVLKEERKAAGIEDPFETQRKRPLSQHIDDFQRYLEDKGSTVEHVKLTIQRIRDLTYYCGFQRIGDILPEPVQRYLAESRANGRSVASSNHYLRAAKMFTRWLVRNRRSSDDRLISLSLMNSKIDIRRERRTLSMQEIEQLLFATQNGKTFRGLAGYDRYVLYLVALNTGLRAAELASLSAHSFTFDVSPATVTVEAAYSKHRRRDVLPIRGDLATIVASYLAVKKRKPSEKLWPGSWSLKASAKMLRVDLAAAEIPYRDAYGRVFDFHSFRHQFISNLARGGVHPKEAQALARHSTITLTMDRYTHLGIVDLRNALDRLPGLPACHQAQSEPAVGSGTTGFAKTGRKKVPTVVPSGAENGAVQPAAHALQIASVCTETGAKPGQEK